MARKSNHTSLLPQLTDPELDLLAHLEQGYQLETDSLGRNPVPGPLQAAEVIQPVSVHRETITTVKERGLITPAKGQHPLTLVARLTKKSEVSFPRP